MMLGYKKLGGVVLGAVALLTLLPAAADAQFIRYSPIFWSFEGRGGYTIPVGDFSDVADAGPSVGAGFAYFLNPRFALRVDGGLDLFQDKDDAVSGGPAPKIDQWRYFGGFEVHLVRPTEETDGKGASGAKRGAMVTLNVGVGGVTYNSDQFIVEDFDGTTNQPSPGFTTRAAFQDTYFGLNGGLRLGINAGSVVTIFVGGDVHVAFVEEEDTAPLAALFGQQPIGTLVSIPLQGGLRFNLP